MNYLTKQMKESTSIPSDLLSPWTTAGELHHAETVVAKGNRTVGFLQRNIRGCTTKVRSATYVSVVCPTLEYTSTVWDPYKQKDTQLL